MKLKVVLFAIVILAASACTQKTCPTYAKKEVKTEKSDPVRL